MVAVTEAVVVRPPGGAAVTTGALFVEEDADDRVLPEGRPVGRVRTLPLGRPEPEAGRVGRGWKLAREVDSAGTRRQVPKLRESAAAVYPGTGVVTKVPRQPRQNWYQKTGVGSGAALTMDVCVVEVEVSVRSPLSNPHSTKTWKLDLQCEPTGSADPVADPPRMGSTVCRALEQTESGRLPRSAARWQQRWHAWLPPRC